MMKKVITLCLFVFTLFIGTQSVIAQNKIEINAEASKTVESINTYVKLNDSQKEYAYKAFEEYFAAKANLKKTKHVNEKSYNKIKIRLESKLKTILTEEQFERFATNFNTKKLGTVKLR